MEGRMNDVVTNWDMIETYTSSESRQGLLLFYVVGDRMYRPVAVRKMFMV